MLLMQRKWRESIKCRLHSGGGVMWEIKNVPIGDNGSADRGCGGKEGERMAILKAILRERELSEKRE